MVTSDFDASDRDAFEIRIKMRAGSVQPIMNSGNKVTSAGTKSKSGNANAFELKIDNMPELNISKISPLDVSKTFNGTTPSMTIADITLDAPTSKAQAFSDWFYAPQRATTLRNGTLVVKAHDLKTDVMTFKLSQLEIVGFSAATGSGSSSQQVAITKVLLRPRGLEMKVN